MLTIVVIIQSSSRGVVLVVIYVQIVTLSHGITAPFLTQLNAILSHSDLCVYIIFVHSTIM